MVADSRSDHIYPKRLSYERTEAPTCDNAPADVTVDCESIPAVPAVTATDNCDPTLTVNYVETSNTVVEGCGVIVRTWTVTEHRKSVAKETKTSTGTATEATKYDNAPADRTADCKGMPAVT